MPSFFTHLHSDMFSQVGEEGVELHWASQEFIHSTNIYWVPPLPHTGNTARQDRCGPALVNCHLILVTAP